MFLALIRTRLLVTAAVLRLVEYGGQLQILDQILDLTQDLTRVRLGNAETLSRHRFYAQLIEHFQQHGDFIVIPPKEE